MEPKISIIVPIYKVERYLEQCISSLTSQSLREIEILAVNDGSPDDCHKILQRLGEKDSRIRILTKENGGLSDARNHGLAAARGEYIAFLDGDDFADSTLYQFLYEKAKETDADLVACPIRYVFSSGKTKSVSSGLWDTEDPREIKDAFTRFYPAVWNKLYRRSLFAESGVSFKVGAFFEDVEFSHRLFPYLRRIAVIEEASVNYVQREDAITARPDGRLFHYLTNFESILAFFRDRGLWEAWHDELEFASCRYLLATFLSRASLLPKEDFEKALGESTAFLDAHFPHRKKNPYFSKRGPLGLYLRHFTPAFLRLIRRK